MHGSPDFLVMILDDTSFLQVSWIACGYYHSALVTESGLFFGNLTILDIIFFLFLQNHVFLRGPLHLGRAGWREAWPKWRGGRPHGQSQVIENPLLKCVPLLNCYRFLS